MVKKIIVLMTFLISTIYGFYSGSLLAQNEGEFSDIMIDSLQNMEDLLDSNLAYKSLYDSLDSEGDWVAIKKSDFILSVAGEEANVNEIDYSDNEVIYVWRPFASYNDNYWNPYSSGRWVYTYSGWIWVSNYNWGWAPYHYGRWHFSVYYGWIWIPGRIWAPNWCMWRHHDHHIGWYPHGPRLFWRDKHHRRHHNRVIKTYPKNWTFIEKKNFTREITKDLLIKDDDLIKNSKKLKLTRDDETRKKYNGPDIKVISTETGKKISPVEIKITDDRVKPTLKDDRVDVYVKDPADKERVKTEAPVTKTKEKEKYTKTTTENDDGNVNKSKTPNSDYETPKTKTETPKTKSETPKTKTEPPETKTEAPKTKTEAPKTKSEPPETKTEAPKTKSEPPETKTEPPKTKTEAPKYSPPKQETKQPRQETRPPKQETQTPKQSPRNENKSGNSEKSGKRK
jgi:hypothetical protein